MHTTPQPTLSSIEKYHQYNKIHIFTFRTPNDFPCEQVTHNLTRPVNTEILVLCMITYALGRWSSQRTQREKAVWHTLTAVAARWKTPDSSCVHVISGVSYVHVCIQPRPHLPSSVIIFISSRAFWFFCIHPTNDSQNFTCITDSRHRYVYICVNIA